MDASRDIGNLTEGDVLKLTCTFNLGSFSQRITVGQSSTEITTAPGGVNVAGLDDFIAIASAVDFQPQFSMEFKVKVIAFVYKPREEIRIRNWDYLNTSGPYRVIDVTETGMSVNAIAVRGQPYFCASGKKTEVKDLLVDY